MGAIVVDWLLASAVKLELLCNDQILGPATGFFLERDESIWLVSNWHVFSGRRTDSGQPIHSSCFTPDQLRARPKVIVNGEARDLEMTFRLVDIRNGEPLWFQHPTMGQDVDVAAVKISKDDLNSNILDREGKRLETVQLSFVAVPFDTFDADLLASVGSDVFVVGFPRGLTKQSNLAIFKRGTIASEPQLPFDNLPLFAVDCATREGMSGSPVFMVGQGAVIHRNRSMSFGSGRVVRFMGIYSGRYGVDDELAAQLGRVWLPQNILEVLESEVRGSYALR